MFCVKTYALKTSRPIPLSTELIDEIEDTRPYVREAAVKKLEKILKGRNIGQARSARDALEKIIEDENTTRRVAQAATQILAPIHQQELEEQQRTDKIAREYYPRNISGYDT